MKTNKLKRQVKDFIKEDKESAVIYGDSALEFSVSFINFKYMTIEDPETIDLFVFDALEIIGENFYLYYGRDKNMVNLDVVNSVKFHHWRPFDERKV